MTRLGGIALALVLVVAGCAGDDEPADGGPGQGNKQRVSAAETAVLRSGSLRRLAVSDGRRAVEGILAADCLAPDLAVVAPPCHKVASGRSPALLRLVRGRLLITTGAPAGGVSVQTGAGGEAVNLRDADPSGHGRRRWSVSLPPVSGATPLTVRVAPQRTDSGYAEFRVLVRPR
jgi:hypothetical protein